MNLHFKRILGRKDPINLIKFKETKNRIFLIIYIYIYIYIYTGIYTKLIMRRYPRINVPGWLGPPS